MPFYPRYYPLVFYLFPDDFFPLSLYEKAWKGNKNEARKGERDNLAIRSPRTSELHNLAAILGHTAHIVTIFMITVTVT